MLSALPSTISIGAANPAHVIVMRTVRAFA
jgi:hypothetical protein